MGYYDNCYYINSQKSKYKNGECIKLKDLLLRHSKYFKEKKTYNYLVEDVIIEDFIITEDEETKRRFREECLEKGKDYFSINIVYNGCLELKVIHEGDNVEFIFKLADRDSLESCKTVTNILEGFYTEVKKIGRIHKTKRGFNLKIDMYDAFRYRGANVFVYIKDESFEKVKEIKKRALKRGFLENEIIYDIEGHNNFRSMYDRSLKEGDLVVIPDLGMIEKDLKSLEQFFLNFIAKKASFCIDEYTFLYDLYEQSSSEDVISSMMEFFRFCSEKI